MAITPLAASLQTQAAALFRCNETFRAHDRTVTLIQVQVFLAIASADDHSLTMADLARSLEVSQAVISTTITLLGSGKSSRLRQRISEDARLNLVELRQDLLDRRRFTLALTRQGRNLLTAMLATLKG